MCYMGSIPKKKKKIIKKKISRPTDPSNFGPVSGNPSFIFFGLIYGNQGGGGILTLSEKNYETLWFYKAT